MNCASLNINLQDNPSFRNHRRRLVDGSSRSQPENNVQHFFWLSYFWKAVHSQLIISFCLTTATYVLSIVLVQRNMIEREIFTLQRHKLNLYRSRLTVRLTSNVLFTGRRASDRTLVPPPDWSMLPSAPPLFSWRRADVSSLVTQLS